MKKIISIIQNIETHPEMPMEEIYNNSETDSNEQYDKDKLVATVKCIKNLKGYDEAFLKQVEEAQAEWDAKHCTQR